MYANASKFNSSAAILIYSGICHAQEPALSNKVKILGKNKQDKQE